MVLKKGEMMNATMSKETWPKILIRHASGQRAGIISMEEAVKRFGIDERTVNWFRQGGLAGTPPRKNGKDIGMLELYTAHDALRDAAPDLLKALKGIYHLALEMKGTRYLSLEERQAVEFAKETLAKTLGQ
jgi:hypothetical protein